jgi:hypothetical protein
MAATVAAHYIALRPALATCLQRATGRGEQARVPGHPPLTDEEPIRLMWEVFADLGAYEGHSLDSSDMSESQTADRIIELLDRGPGVVARLKSCSAGPRPGTRCPEMQGEGPSWATFPAGRL